jgi:hypothetical protein
MGSQMAGVVSCHLFQTTMEATVFKSEAHLQAHCYQWAHNTFPDTRGLLFAVPNGGTRNIREGQSLKAQGVVPGVADMLFLWKGNTYAFEFKFGAGKQSPAQKEWQAKVNGHIENYIIVNDAYAFKEFFKTIVNG